MGRSAHAAWFACVLGACAPSGVSVAGATEAAGGHVQDYSKFATWAARARRGRTALTDRDASAIAELTFAPVRLDQDVVAAWVQGARPSDSQVSMPAGVQQPAELDWVTVRDPALGAIDVVDAQRCPVDVPDWWRADIEGCVLIASERSWEGAEPLRVTVAYRRAP